jgi:hypothetical protein
MTRQSGKKNTSRRQHSPEFRGEALALAERIGIPRAAKKLVATTLAEIPGEAIPLLGIPILLAATAYEIKLACENLDDLDQLYSDMGMADETSDDVMHSVCNPELPDAGTVWDGVVEKSGEWLDLAREAM